MSSRTMPYYYLNCLAFDFQFVNAHSILYFFIYYPSSNHLKETNIIQSECVNKSSNRIVFNFIMPAIHSQL